MANISPKTKLQITTEDIQKISEYFQSAPPPPKFFTVRECLVELIPTIKEARARGHTLESIKEILIGIGIKVTTRHVVDALRNDGSVKKPTGKKPSKFQQKTSFAPTPAASPHFPSTAEDFTGDHQGGDDDFTA